MPKGKKKEFIYSGLPEFPPCRHIDDSSRSTNGLPTEFSLHAPLAAGSAARTQCSVAKESQTRCAVRKVSEKQSGHSPRKRAMLTSGFFNVSAV